MSLPTPDLPTAVPARTATPSGERALRALAGLAVVVLMVACGGAPKRPSTGAAEISRPAGDPSQMANAVLFRAIGLVGTPYRWGGNTPESGFDCSGLVGYVYRDAAGVVLPRTSSAISEIRAPKVKRGQLASGDLVFFGARGRVNHVGIYVGEGRFVHAPNSGGTVRLDELDGHYWRDAWLYGKRVLR
ncbi:MAG: C40 family peptidase [Lysobacteraceae bacterium]